MNSQFVDINLLPRPIRPSIAGAAWARMMAPGILLLLISTILVLGSVTLKMRNDRLLAEQRQEMQQRREQVGDFSSLMGQVTLLQEQITTLVTQTEQLRGDAERVNAANPPFTPFLRAVNDTLLPRMKLTGIVSQPNDTFLVQGEAGSDALVVSYVQALKQRTEIRSVTPQLVEALGGTAAPGSVRFTLVVVRNR